MFANMRTKAWSLLLGIGIASLTLLVPYEFCMAGDARGFPFAITNPTCTPPWGPSIALEPWDGGQAIDFGTFTVDAALWAIVAYLGLRLYSRLRRKVID